MLRPDSRNRFCSVLALLAVGGILAGCNSRESLYSQGPWGPRDVKRNYPQYPSPWGFRSAEAVLVPGSNASRPQALGRSQDTGMSVAELQFDHRIAGLPADPLPSTTVTSIDADPPASSERSHPIVEALHPALDQASGPAESPPGVFSAPRRASSYAGTWKVKDEKGNSCLVHLSSAASLDHYKASASGCSGEGLRAVSTWSFDQNQVVLFARGEKVAHLNGSEAALTGTLSRTGARLEMSR